MKTWRPQSANGWYPKISPDGLHITYGFWQCHIADLTTGVETEVLGPAAPDGHHPRLHPLGWLNNQTFIAATEEGPAAMYSISLATLIPVPLVAPGFTGVSFGNAEAGTWGIFLQRQDGSFPYCLKNGVAFHDELDGGGQPVFNQYGCAVAGTHLLTADKNAGYALLHFIGTALSRTLPADNLWFVNEEGDVTTGYYGPCKVYPYDGGTTMVDGTVTPWRKESPGWPVRVNGELWIWNAADEAENGLIMGRRLGELNPIVLRDFPAVAVHARYQPATQMWVVAGNSDKGALQVRWVPMETPRFVLVQAPAMVIVGRSFWLGFFMFANGPAAPGNCTLAVRNITGAQSRPVILTSESIGLVTGTILGYFCAAPPGGTVADVEAAAVIAAAAGMRPVAYWDARTWPSTPTLPAGSWMCVQAYCGAAESLVDFETSLLLEIANVPLEYDVVIVAQCYTSNALNTTDLVSLVPVYARLLRDNPRVVAILVFSGAGRATGYEDHPEVWSAWTTLFAGGGSTIPGVPGSPGGPGVPPPRPFLHRRSTRTRLYRQDRRSPNRWR